MTRIMLILLTVVLGVRGYPSTSLGVQQMTINGRIYLDDANQFNFERLSLFIQHSKQQNGLWTPIAPVVPDEKGEFVISVPADSWLSINVDTTDPTIRFLRNPADEFDFYSLGQNEKVRVYYQRLYVPGSSANKMEWRIELKRGAGFSICMVDRMKGGAIFFRNLDDKREDEINMFSFADLTEQKGTLIGGLIPGDYEITYVDDNDVERMKQKVRLSRGRVSYVKCK